MRNPDDEGFITLHRGRMPVLLQVVAALAMACALVFFWKVTARADVQPEIGSGSSLLFRNGAGSWATAPSQVLTGGIIQGKCASGRIPVIVGADMTAPCTGGICPLMVYKCAVPADLTDQE